MEKKDNLSEILEGLGEEKSKKNKKGFRGKLITSFLFIFLVGSISGGLASYGVFYYLFSNGNIEGNEVVKNITENVTVEEGSAVIDAVNKIVPSVVSITATSKVMSFWGDVVEKEGGGTGFVVTNDGLIMTNKHVVSGASEFKVITSEGKYYDAEVVAQDPLFDFALLKIDAKGLPVADLGDSDNINIGQRVVAVGNALGEYQNTVTVGVVSARGRSVTASNGGGGASRLEGLIQTDAPISPGNSGGPLVNIRGQVIGVNTAMNISGNSIAFAIPINSAKIALNSYLEKGKIERAFLGIRYINITRDFAAVNNLNVTSGALITTAGERGVLAIVPGGPADKAGLEENDIIIEINGEKVTENRGIISILASYAPGDSVEVKYLRKGEEEVATVELGEL